MRLRTRRTLSEQLRLFAPIPPLCWTDLPADVRERTVALLARLLRQHTRPSPVPEGRDE
jgi:hypothetical protein